MNESSSPRRDLQVFDFKVEDDDDKHLRKFSKISTPDTFARVYRSRRNKNDTGLTTHQLQAKVKQGNVLQDAQINEVGVKNIPSIPCVDVDVAGSILDSETGCSNPSFETMEDTIDSKVKNSELGADNQSNSISQENHCHSKLNVDYYDRPENRDTTGGASTPETSQIGPSGFPSSVHSSPNIFPDAQINEVGVKNVPSIPCVDVDVVGSILNSETGCSNPSFETMEDTFDSKVKNSELGADNQSNSVGQENHYQFKLNVDYYDRPENRDTTGGASTPETSQIGPSGSPSSKESVDVSSDADDCMNYESAPISAASDIAENGVFHLSPNGCGFDGAHISDASDADETNTEVVLRPDYIIYQDNYYMGPMLTFSHSCIKINVSTACMKQEAFDLEWGLDDLINIKCQLVQSSGTVIIKINVISRNANQLDHVSDTSGIEELKIAVVDSNWSLIQEEITSLNVKYLAIWNIMLNMDVEDYETKSGGSRCYFPNFEEPFDEVIYPKGDPDAVSLSKRDFDLLQPDTFINDTIIDFYIQYLKNQIQEEEKPRFHFFNSFFFRKLADLDKNPSSALDGKAAFLRVRKWTRKVNLFEKDYIFIPVNFNLHWSLIVICHPGEVINLNDKELDHALKVPCILHMDSIKGNHSGLKNLLQSYLWEEWKERHKDALDEDVSALFSNLRFLPLVLPQQENSYDCGLFLLHYLELFLAEAPFTFNPFKVTKFSNFLNVDWFLPAEAYLKRTLIQRLISELVENHGSREIPSSDGSDDHQYIESIENRIGIEHPEVNRVSKTLHAGQGIEMTLLSGSSALDPQSFNNSGMVLKDLFEPGTTSGTTLAQCQSFDQRSSDYRFNSSIFSMEEDSDLGEFMYTNFQQVARVTPQEDSNFGEQFMYLATDTNFQQVAGVTPQEDSNFGEQFTYLATDTNFQQVAGVTPQEDSDLGEQFMYMATDTNFQQVAGVTPQACSLPHLPRDCGNGTNHIPEFSLQEAVSSPSGTSDDTEEIGITEYCPDDGNEPIASNEADQGERICSLIGNTEHFIDISASAGNNLPTLPVVGISDDSIMNCDGYKNEDIHSPCQETPTLTLCQVSDAVDDEAACDDVRMVDGTEPDISEEQAAKRRRVMPLECRSEGNVTESNL